MNNKHVQSIEQSMNKIRNNNLSVQKSKFPSISIPNIRRPPSKYLILILLAILGGIILCILIFAVYYYKESCENKKSFGTYLSEFNITKSPCKGKSPIVQLDSAHKKEVYHIENQLYTYDQARCKCNSYGGKLATKNQIIQAYNKGANWCSYGWSEGGNAYYPTQKCEWDKLQNTKEHRKCGNPGINGGRFPQGVRFGVNCFGYKPKGKSVKEKEPTCENPDDNKPFCRKDANKDLVKASTSDDLVDFNNEKWSIYDN